MTLINVFHCNRLQSTITVFWILHVYIVIYLQWANRICRGWMVGNTARGGISIYQARSRDFLFVILVDSSNPQNRQIVKFGKHFSFRRLLSKQQNCFKVKNKELNQSSSILSFLCCNWYISYSCPFPKV